MKVKLIMLILLVPFYSFSQSLKTIVSDEYNHSGGVQNKSMQIPSDYSVKSMPLQFDTSNNALIVNEDSIVSFVVQYYQPELDKLKQEVSAELKITKENGNLKIEYAKDGYSYFTRSIPLPTVLLKGDLNRDGLKDVVVSVWATGGTHAIWNDVFLFLGTKNGYNFYKKYDSYSLGLVKSYYAKFYPAHLKNGCLIGKMSMLAHNDPGCCPSLFYKTTLKFINGKFKIVSEQKIHEWDKI